MPSTTTTRAPDHLNATGCYIRYVDGKGRGVFASRVIPGGTLIEISPVLLFTKEEYHQHGRHTILDHFTFKWPDGRMALALGLGSLFNHSDRPNVSFSLDTSTDSIQYITSRIVHPDEELCIFYGHTLWFQDVDTDITQQSMVTTKPIVEDAWGGLLGVTDQEEGESIASTRNPWREGDPDQVVQEDDLPFTRVKLVDYEDEDDKSSIQTIDVWVVDIPDPRHTNTLIKWMKKSGLDTPELSHLKRIRKQNDLSTFLIAPTSPSTPLPPFPESIDLPEPYTIQVPKTSALTEISFRLKSSMWPTTYTPPRKHELEEWTRDEVSWAWEAMKKTVEYAREQAQDSNQYPIAAYIPLSYGEEPSLSRPFIAHDTRKSTGHPLRHACQNLIRLVADHLASHSSLPSPPSTSPLNASSSDTNYLLTSLTLFTTHEPCIMCSMALLHSRVKQVIYLLPMPRTGGCGGGEVCLSKLKGVNHRFAICRWKMDQAVEKDMNEALRVGDSLDA